MPPELLTRIRDWLANRDRLSAREESFDYPSPGAWQDSDDEANYIVECVAKLFNIEEVTDEQEGL